VGNVSRRFVSVNRYFRSSHEYSVGGISSALICPLGSGGCQTSPK
jgi:hypothetical protein